MLRVEISEGLAVFGDFLGKKFEGNKAAQARIFRLVHNAHPTATEFLNDAVMRDGLADERTGFRHLASMLGCGDEASQRSSATLRSKP